jgi:phosphopentomutase
MRAFILLMDSFGVGATPDAHLYQDEGADTFGHIWQARHALAIPHLISLGILHIAHLSTGKVHSVEHLKLTPKAAWGCAAELSKGKDTPSGHWEMTGAPVTFEWGYFPKTTPSFPDELINQFIEKAKLPGILGNKHASGTDILEEFGEEHICSGKPIVYTSADSVFQIAAHEAHFGLQRLYEICEIARELLEPYNIGRVIARPFAGEVGKFYRTGNRKDLSVLPPMPTLLDHLKEAGREVIAVGKIGDIFAHQGTTQEIKANGNDELFAKTLALQETAPDGSLVFTNFVDFDMLYGHRRDIDGYAKALESFDHHLGEFIRGMKEDDIAVITADHGCDPTWPGSDHTRENIPILIFGPKIQPIALGHRASFADIGQSLAKYLGVKPLAHGEVML